MTGYRCGLCGLEAAGPVSLTDHYASAHPEPEPAPPDTLPANVVALPSFHRWRNQYRAAASGDRS